MRHFLRYGTHSEKDFFLEETEVNSYDAAIVNANMLAYTPKAMSAFALRLNKPFFIDPQTHAFQHGFEYITNKNGVPKQSIKNLATSYGGAILSALENSGSVSLEDFSSEEAKKNLVKNVLEFQRDTVHNIVTTGSEAEYVTFALNDEGSGLSRENVTPSGVIAPYFYIDGSNDSALELNVAFVEEANRFLTDGGPMLIAQLVMSKDALANDSFRKKIISAYASCSAKKVFIWIDAFDETEVSESLLQSLKSLIEGVASSKEVVNLYGGYFSILLTKIENGLEGVCHGMEYGESRAVVPVGGGLSRAKYYFRPLHKRLSAEDFLRIIGNRQGWLSGSKNQEFAREVCDCHICEDLEQFAETQTYEVKSKNGSRRGETSTSAAKRHSLAHYLVSKKKEFEFVEKSDMASLLKDLGDAKTKYAQSAGDSNANHIDRWIKVLTPGA